MVKTYEQTLLERGIEKGIEQGIEKGIEQGIEKGIEQGRLESLRESIIGLISKRFPEACESEARQKLLTLDTLTTLQFIHNRAFEWKSYDDIWCLPDVEN